MTFAEAIATLSAKVQLERQAVAKLELLVKALQENPALEELLISLIRAGR